MKRIFAALILTAFAIGMMVGCNMGTVSYAAQKAKANSLQNFAKRSPNYDKVERH